jgi:hypothetical protein
MDIPIIKESQVKKEVNKPLSIPIISAGKVKEVNKPISIPISIPIISPGKVVKEGKPLPIQILSKTQVTEVLPKVRIRGGPTGPRPTIPTGDPCCAKVCTLINDKLRYLQNERRFKEEQLSTAREGGLTLKRQIDALSNKLTSLQNSRFDMVEKGSCKCIEEVKFAERVLPVFPK